MKGIYLDNSVTTKPSLSAVSKMMPFYSEEWGVFSQPHRKGQELYPPVLDSYRNIYKLLKAKDSDTIIFTASGAEAVNHVILGAYFTITKESGKNHFITSRTDEAPALMSISRLEDLGCIGTMVKPVDGYITADTIRDAITPRTALVSLSWGSGLTGLIEPVQEISAILKERGIKFHLEASHIIGKMYFDLEETGADYITFAGDLIHSTKASGALWIKSGEKLSPFIMGGIEQGGLRSGPLDAANLAAFGEACKEAIESQDFVATEISRLRAKLEKGIVARVKNAKVLFQNEMRLPHVTSIVFPGCSSEALLFELNRRHVYACMGGGSLQQISYVLHALGVSKEEAASALSFSLSRETTEEEIDRAIEITEETAEKLQTLSSQLGE